MLRVRMEEARLSSCMLSKRSIAELQLQLIKSLFRSCAPTMALLILALPARTDRVFTRQHTMCFIAACSRRNRKRTVLPGAVLGMSFPSGIYGCSTSVWV